MGRERHESIWNATVPGLSFSGLSGDGEYDIAVIGAGITGLSTALLLAQAGKRVVVLERDRVASGATGSTSAHLTTLIDLTYEAMEKSAGQEGVQLISQSAINGLDRIEGFVREYSIECGFSRMPGYYFAEEREGLDTVKREFEAANRAGQPVHMVDSVPLPFRTEGGFRIDNQAVFHPIAYCNGLAQAIFRLGSQVFTNTSVVDVEDGAPCRITTSKGEIIVRDIVLATHTPLGFNPVQAELTIERSYAIALRVLGPNIGALYWNTHEPYEYIRPYITPNGMETLIVGGADHDVGSAPPIDSFKYLVEYARKRFGTDDLLYTWSAQHYDPSDSLPLMGRSPFSTHIYIVTGMAGDGLVLGTVGAMVVADQILGRENPYSQVYSPSRLKLHGIQEFVRLNLRNSAKILGDRLTVGKDAIELLPGEASVGGGLDPTAHYRDGSGMLHSVKATCTHLGCVVHWNDAEKTWDCPCHGSRFTIDGGIIEGPALSPLERKH